MKDIILKSLKLFLITFLSGIMCFFLVTSLNFMKVGLFSENIGYDMYGATEENLEMKHLYTYYFEDGDDEKYKEYEEQGYKLSGVSIYSEINPTANITLSIISQVMCLVITGLFIYNTMWKTGNRDKEFEKLHGGKVYKAKGLYCGILAILPMLLALTFAIVTKNSICANVSTSLYAILNGYAFEILTAVNKNARVFADIGIWQILTYYGVLLIFPIVSTISYFIGFKDIVIMEKLVYKNSNKKEKR
ncbi:MAG: hypothetical protein IKV81_02465 [Clostridia bacterium]|nr:hypothetical protein [Clostridia bacterium]